jgi:hypothetical protein
MDNLTKLDMTTVESTKIIPETKEDDYNDCEICGTELDSSVTLRCKHKFHYDCVFDWYVECQGKSASGSQSQYVRRSCPYCRSDGGYLPLPSKDAGYIKGIHKPSHKPRLKKITQSKSTKITVGTGQCLGIAKSTGAQCKLGGKPQYSGYCGWHKNQAPAAM